MLTKLKNMLFALNESRKAHRKEKKDPEPSIAVGGTLNELWVDWQVRNNNMTHRRATVVGRKRLRKMK